MPRSPPAATLQLLCQDTVICIGLAYSLGDTNDDELLSAFALLLAVIGLRNAIKAVNLHQCFHQHGCRAIYSYQASLLLMLG